MAFLALIALVVGLAPFTLTPESNGAGERPAVGPSGRAVLRIVAVRPLTITGHGFKPGESVRVSGDRFRKTVTAGARGGFKVGFPRANVCSGVVVIARGSEGSRATVAFAQFSNVHCLDP
jgi:hypothetical protein